AYGLNPRFGTYVTRHIRRYPERFDTYEEAKEFVEDAFKDYHPEVLVNNHIADRIANVYSQWVEIPNNQETVIDRWGRESRVVDFVAPLVYHTPEHTTARFWGVIEEFKNGNHADTDQFDSHQEFLDSCHEQLTQYSERLKEATLAMAKLVQEGHFSTYGRIEGYCAPVNARRPAHLNRADSTEILRFLENKDKFAEILSDQNDR
ncbi:MAG: hypothetical protein J5897_02015, partial [Candidatus Methanomethylophilus sp.]|nr:hypothetical protein [Methanomethylophilus sp.]